MTTRILPLLVLSMMTLATVGTGCAAEDTGSYGSLHKAKSTPKDPVVVGTDGKTEATRTEVTVNGTTDHADATSVDIEAMNEDGSTTKVATATVEDGKFDAKLPADGSPTGIFLVKVKGIGDAIVGSATINGIPAFIKGFTIDAAVDAQTTFKTEILSTIAKKGTPGVQNYLNVIDAYVNAQLTDVIVTDGAISTDVSNITGAVSDAIIAAENAIADSLSKAGYPIDLTELTKWQSSAVTGFQGWVTDAQGKRADAAKSLIAGLQAAAAKGAAPIDDAIFNAVVNGGAAFGGTMKEKAPEQGFAANKSAFMLTSNLSADKANTAFSNTDIASKVGDAAKTFLSSVTSSVSADDLKKAQSAFGDVLSGKDTKPEDIFGAFKPIINALGTAFAKLDFKGIFDALQQMDQTKLDLPTDFTKLLGGADLSQITSAIKSVQKQQVGQ